MRFQKRIKIMPGVSINLSKSGVSTSIGPKGSKINIGHGKTKATIGLPGTGISHTEAISTNKSASSKLNEIVFFAAFIFLIIFLIF